jgi:hypothetical protein
MGARLGLQHYRRNMVPKEIFGQKRDGVTEGDEKAA